MSGQWGSTILQFAITLVVVVVLVGIVYWLVRRYSGGFGRIGRGRVPRLAVLDAMSVDARRRLILVRRDNVEHLILVGGPADVVIEQAIQRPRQRATARPQSAPQAVAGGEMPVELPRPAPESQTIPFPQPVAAIEAPAQPAAGFFSTRRSGQPQAERIAAVASLAEVDPTPEFRPHLSGLPPYEPAAERDVISPFPGFGDNGRRAQADMGTTVAEQPAAAAPVADIRSANATVNDLEREMARLLGEITVKRTS